MKVDIDEIQERYLQCLRPYQGFPQTFERPPRDESVGPHIIHITQALGALADNFIVYNKAKMIEAVAEIILVCLYVLSILRQPAGGVLNSKILLMEQNLAPIRANPRGE
jgi:hypothetical protein